MKKIQVRVLRPLLLRGERQEVGILECQPLDAVALVESGRAELVRPQDRATIAEAQQREQIKKRKG